MTDPLAQAQAFIERAVEERSGLKHQLSTASAENFQIRRQLDRARDTIAGLETERARIELALEAARDQIDRLERGMRDHVGRVTQTNVFPTPSA